jgi:hypothetical protein
VFTTRKPYCGAGGARNNPRSAARMVSISIPEVY